MSTKRGTWHIGTSGYQYDHWRCEFYPAELSREEWFAWYAKHFDTVEINNTFYNLPETDAFRKWHRQAPEGFLYTLKFSRYGSHIKRLKNGEVVVGNFLDHAGPLRETLGPILVQLPPNWKLNIERLSGFMAAIDGTGCRWAFEFRDRRWLCQQVFDLLHANNAALVVHDMMPDHPREITADWVYLRFHGDNYAGSYSSDFLSARADEIAGWLDEGMDVYAYFNNDAEAAAPHNARDLSRLVAAK